MLEAMPLPLFVEWLDFAERHPFGEERSDWRSGMIASVISNVYRKKGGRRAKPSDFFPKFKRRADAVQRMSPDQIKGQLASFDRAREEAQQSRHRPLLTNSQ